MIRRSMTLIEQVDTSEEQLTSQQWLRDIDTKLDNAILLEAQFKAPPAELPPLSRSFG